MSAPLGTFGPLRPPATLTENERSSVPTPMAEEVPMPAQAGPVLQEADGAIEPGGMA